MRAAGKMMIAGIVLAGFVPGTAAWAAGPSFDCAKAGNVYEKTICASSALSAKDAQLGQLYRTVFKALPADRQAGLKKDQLEWLGDRKTCADDPSTPLAKCMAERYDYRLSVLQAMQDGLDGKAEGMAGAYDYIEPGFSGGLIIRDGGAGGITANLGTVAARNLSMCEVEAKNGYGVGNRLVLSGEDQCRLTVVRGAGREVTVVGDNCNDFCGMNAMLDGRYRLK